MTPNQADGLMSGMGEALELCSYGRWRVHFLVSVILLVIKTMRRGGKKNLKRIKVGWSPISSNALFKLLLPLCQ